MMKKVNIKIRKQTYLSLESPLHTIRISRAAYNALLEHSILLDTTIVAAVISPFVTKSLDLLVSEIQKYIKKRGKVHHQIVQGPPERRMYQHQKDLYPD
jgi:hypothetical protein